MSHDSCLLYEIDMSDESCLLLRYLPVEEEEHSPSSSSSLGLGLYEGGAPRQEPSTIRGLGEVGWGGEGRSGGGIIDGERERGNKCQGRTSTPLHFSRRHKHKHRQTQTDRHRQTDLLQASTW